MCCDSPDPPKPDKNIGAAQKQMSDLAIRQQNWYETNIAPKVLSQMDQSLAISAQQAQRQGEMQDFQTQRAKQYDERYWGTQVPLEDELIQQARTFNTAAERERMAGMAGADVEQATAQAQASLGRGLRARGVNQGSAAAISAMGDMQMQSALAKAGAYNKTREAARQLGWTRMGEAAALGRGLPGFGATSAQLAMGAGGQALQAGNSGMGTVRTAGDVGAQAGGQLQTLQGLGGVSTDLYNAQMQGYNAQAQQAAGNMQAVGAVAGAAIAAFF